MYMSRSLKSLLAGQIDESYEDFLGKMKRTAIHAPFMVLAIVLGCRQGPELAEKHPEMVDASNAVSVETRIVEASCGQCNFSLPGAGCDLAVRINGTTYYVDGSGLDDHGDAHGELGMCNCVRQAKVIGEIEDGRFRATSFEVLPPDFSADE